MRDDQRNDAFPFGVCSGDPSDNAVVLWTAVRGAPAPADDVELRWEIARSPDFVDVVARGDGTALATLGGTFRVDVGGLQPATRYWYRFAVNDEISSTGRAKTLPTGQVDQLRIGVTSCAMYRGGYYNVYGRLADRAELDVVLHLGDYIYEFGNALLYEPWNIVDERVMDPDHACFTLEDYRRRYACTRSDPDLQALHRAHSIVHLWEDHEVVDDCWSTGCDDEDTMPVTFAERKSAAVRAFWEWMPIRWPEWGVSSEPPPEDERLHPHLYRSASIGDLVDLFVIDTRHEGREQLPDVITDDEYLNPDRHMMSAVQREWLLDGLRESTARWRLIANPTMMSRLGLTGLPEEVTTKVKKLKKPVGLEQYGNPGQWDGYASDRRSLFAALRDMDIANLVVVTGDIHTSWAQLLTDGSDLPPVGVEFVTPSVTTRAMGDQLDTTGAGAQLIESMIYEQLPWVHHVDLRKHGYVVVTFTGDAASAEWWVVPTIKERTDAEQRAARFVMTAGSYALESDHPPQT